MIRGLGRDKAELRKVPGPRINRLGPLPQQKVPRPEGHAGRLLLRVFHGNRSQGRPRPSAPSNDPPDRLIAAQPT